MRTVALIALGLVACTKAGPAQDGAGVAPPSKTPPVPNAVTVQITAATLGEDCIGGGAAEVESKRAPGSDSEADMQQRQPCAQSSMQLSVVAAPGASPTRLTVTRVELFDDKGKRVGEMKPGAPTRWSQDGTYQAWDQQVEPGRELQVSYALGPPPLGPGANRSARYVLKAVVTVGGGDQAVQHDVMLQTPAYLPPDVET